MVRRVAIIGAGVSGLASIKCCLDEGLEPTCFEKNDGIGGIWQFTETPEEGRTTVYRSVISNTSKEMTCFSDFPFPADFPNYLRHSKLLDYLRMYAENFHLLDYIHFQTTVCSIRKQPDFTGTGQWLVVTEKHGEQASVVFDAIMVCSGRYAKLNLPLDHFPGIENFKGRLLHSWEYRDQKPFEGKRVLVVGAGNSGGDIAVEIGRTSAQVFLSTRTGTWVLSRISNAGWPLDMIFTSRFLRFIERIPPACIMNRIRAKKLGQWFNHENYGLIPVESSWQPLTVNDELPSCILCGDVVVKPNVKMFTETSVIFEDGTVEENVDVVVFATGYKASFSFLEESFCTVCKGHMNLYKQVFPPQLEKPTLAVIGAILVNASILPAVELQARWVTRVFNGSIKLPPESEQISEITERKKALLKQGIPIETDRVMTSFIDYMDEIAACIGVKPNIPLLFLLDTKLALEVIFGPCTPYQYRLTGPGKWKKARSAILTQWDRTLKPLKTRVIDGSPKCSMVSCLVKILGLTAFLVAALFVFQ